MLYTHARIKNKNKYIYSLEGGIKMKKTIKLLAVLMSFALLVCGFVLATVGAQAADDAGTPGFSYAYAKNDDGSYAYTTTASLDTAFAEALNGTQITMTGDTLIDAGTDYTIDQYGAKLGNPIAALTAYKGPFVLDLGGHTLSVVQHHKGQTINIQCQNKLTVENGTIKTVWDKETGDGGTTTDIGYPLFTLSWGNAQILFDNVNTYGGTLVYSTGEQDAKVTIIGGNHYAMTDASDTFGGFIEARGPTIFFAHKANFFVGKNNGFITATSAGYTGTDSDSIFEFYDCGVFGQDIETNLIRYSNENTTIIFENSRIFGSLGRVFWVDDVKYIGLPLRSSDANKGIDYAQPGSIILDAATWYATEDASGNKAVFADGANLACSPTLDVGTSQIAIGEDCTKIVYDGTNNNPPLDITNDYAFSYCTSPTLEYDGAGNVIRVDYETGAIVPTSVTLNTESYGIYFTFQAKDSATVQKFDLPKFKEIDELNAQGGGVVEVLRDMRVFGHGEEVMLNLQHGITFNLNGNVLNFCQIPDESTGRGQDKNAQSHILLNTTEPIVFNDGILGVKQFGANAAYPLFLGSGKAVDLRIENVTSYSGGLVFLYSGNGSTVNIVGGEHHVYYLSVGSIGGLVGTLCNATVNMTGTEEEHLKILMNDNGRLLGAGATSMPKSNQQATFNLDWCDVLNTKSAKNILIDKANEFTTVNFRYCNIFGSINPNVSTPYDTSVNNPFGGNVAGPLSHSITFDSNTYFSSAATMKENVVSPDVGRFVDGTKTLTVTATHLAGDASYYGFVGTPEEETYSFDRTISGDHFEITAKDGTVSYINGSVWAAITAAGEGGTVKFLGNYTADGSHGDEVQDGNYNSNYAQITYAITLDLNGRTLNIVQGKIPTKRTENGELKTFYNGQDCFKIKTKGAVVIKNGIINAGLYNSSKTYPWLALDTSGYNVTIKDIKSYGGAIAYAFSTTGTFNVEGGEHHVISQPTGTWGVAWFEAHAATDFNASGARFYIEDSRSLIAANSGTYTGEKTFTFTNCDVIAEGNGGMIINYANERSTFEFTGCNIKGKLTPALINTSGCNDTAIPAIKDGAIVFGVGTVYSGTFTESLISSPEGYRLAVADPAISKSLTFYTLVSTDVVTNGYDTRKNISTYAFAYEVIEAAVIDVHLPNGDVHSSGSFLVGETVALPAVDTSVVENTGWVKISYTGNWVDAEGNVFDGTVKGGSDLKLYPEIEVVPFLKDAKYNLTLMAHFQFNLLLPYNLPEGIAITNVAGKSAQTYHDENGVRYNQYALAWPTISSFTTVSSNIDVTFTYTHPALNGGEPVELVQSIKGLTPVMYVETVLADSANVQDGTNKYMETAHTLMADLVRYLRAVNAVNGNTVAKLNQLHTAYGTLCTPYATWWDNILDEQANEATAKSLSEYIKFITFDIEMEKPRIKIVFENGKVTDYTLGVAEGYKQQWHTASGKVNWGSTSYSADNYYRAYYGTDGKIYNNRSGTYYEYTFKDGVQNTKKIGSLPAGVTLTNYVAVVEVDNLPIYNIDKEFKFTLTTEEGTKEGTYSLAAYYTAMKDDAEAGTLAEDTFERIKEFTYATRAYARSAAAYRFGPPIDRVDGGTPHYVNSIWVK